MKTRISKWYLDCVSENGDLFIGYAASLSLGFFPLHLASRVLLLDEKVNQRTVNAWSNQFPIAAATGLHWSCRKLQLTGNWRPLLPPATRVLFQNSGSSIQWNCAQPLSAAEVIVDGQCTLSGFGYAENLVMDIAPAAIGLTRLYWGRFLAQDISIVWIQWEGKEQQLMVLLNGENQCNAVLAPNHVEIGKDLRLHWTNSYPIRTGPVKASVLGSMPWLHRILPLWMTRITENKWRSRGQLIADDRVMAEGWIIHEDVVFDNPMQI